jgi:uncharacterized phage protein (TIGR02216 family)
LKLPPAVFWSLSLREWRALLSPRARGETPMRRDEFDDLMQRYPD